MKRFLSLLSTVVLLALFSVSALAYESAAALDDWCEIETLEMTDIVELVAIADPERLRLSPGADDALTVLSLTGATATNVTPPGGAVAILAITS